MQHFRTIIVGFPNADDSAGHAALKRLQAQLKLYSFLRGLMIGRFHPQSEDPGLWNPHFRPLRAPLPMLAIRHMVENDAPFALRHQVRDESDGARAWPAGAGGDQLLFRPSACCARRRQLSAMCKSSALSFAFSACCASLTHSLA
jgi:hypothetical protein